MDLSTSHYVQLIAALALGVIVFVGAYSAPRRIIVPALVATVPFQPILSVYGSLNMVLIYIVGIAYALSGRLRRFPLIVPILLVLLAYLMAFSQAHRSTYLDHILYLVGFGSNFVLFYIVYNYLISTEADSRAGLRMLVASAVLVAAYCILQFFVGFDSYSVGGIKEFSFAQNLENLRRLVGPFNAAGINGAFFVLQILLFGYLFLYTESRLPKLFYAGMAAVFFGFLVATGSRGSFLTAIGGIGLFAWVFRRDIGTMRMMRLVVVGSAVLALAATIIVTRTEFNVMFDRLASTEFYGAVPDTRRGLVSISMEQIVEKPLLGHGPRLRLLNEWERRIPGHTMLPYPHNLILFVLYTTGIVGLLAWLNLARAMMSRWWRARPLVPSDPAMGGATKLALLLMVVFLVDQLKIEFLRVLLLDIQNYMFALWAIFLAHVDRTRAEARQAQAQEAAESADRYLGGAGGRIAPHRSA